MLLTCSIAYSATAQDASQPAGTWYLGASDATDLFRMFSSEGMEMSPFVGYAIADNIAITLGLDYYTETADGGSGGEDVTNSYQDISVGAAYFFGDNFYAQAGVSLGAVTMQSNDDTSSTSIQIGLGKFIPVKDLWYVSPQLTYSTYSGDEGNGMTSSGASIGISFGARF